MLQFDDFLLSSESDCLPSLLESMLRRRFFFLSFFSFFFSFFSVLATGLGDLDMDLCDGDFDPNLCFNGSLDLERLDDSLSLTGSLKILEK